MFKIIWISLMSLLLISYAVYLGWTVYETERYIRRKKILNGFIYPTYRIGKGWIFK